jgi:uncharacterized glyoxalase superfamily protein PhnB
VDAEIYENNKTVKMKIKDLSITFHTEKIKECVEFYSKYFQAKVTFDAGWYVTVCMESDNAVPIYLSFQSNEEGIDQDVFKGGITLNLMVEDVDSCYGQLKQTELSFVEEISDHEWSDRAFSLYDPIGNLVYVYSERPLHEKYKNAIKE